MPFLRNKQICYQVVAAVAGVADVNLSDTTSYSLVFLRHVLLNDMYLRYFGCLFQQNVIEQCSNIKYTVCSRNKIELYLHFDQ